MNIVMCCWESLLESRIAELLQKQGHNVFIYDKKSANSELDQEYIVD